MPARERLRSLILVSANRSENVFPESVDDSALDTFCCQTSVDSVSMRGWKFDPKIRLAPLFAPTGYLALRRLSLIAISFGDFDGLSP